MEGLSVESLARYGGLKYFLHILNDCFTAYVITDGIINIYIKPYLKFGCESFCCPKILLIISCRQLLYYISVLLQKLTIQKLEYFQFTFKNVVPSSQKIVSLGNN